MQGEWTIEYMALAVEPDFAAETLSCRCGFALRGEGTALFALNRGMRITSVQSRGAELPFGQEMGFVQDGGLARVNLLRFCIPAGQEAVIAYEGPLTPYTEHWAYVRDHVNEACTLVRKDAYAYPMRAAPGEDGVLYACHDAFSYEITARMPRGISALCGGEEADVREERGKQVFRYVREEPSGRLDLVMGRYEIVSEPGLRICLMRHSASVGAIERLRAETGACTALLSDRFGARMGRRPLTMIEIPDGMGGQAGDGYFLQQTYAFVHPEAIDGIYHELAHGWTTARAAGSAKGKRFFDEAIASYLQVFVLRALHGEAAAQRRLMRMRGEVKKAVGAIGDIRATSLSDDGHREQLAYNKGTWMLCALEREMGARAFTEALSAFIRDYDGRDADFPDFTRAMQAHVQKPLDSFFAEWLYSWESTERILSAEAAL